MTNVFSRSWNIAKISFGVVNKDKEMLLFPILSGIFSIIFLLVMLFPTILIYLGVDNGSASVLNYVLIFVTYLGIAFIATFFNVATVYTAKIRFEGGNATFGQSLKFAFSRIFLIFLWAMVSATVGLLLKIIENIAQNMKGPGKIIVIILRSVLGMAWGIVTIFVIPSLVFKGIGPFASIKDSVGILRKTWGESLIKTAGMGIIQFIIFFLMIIVFGVLIFATLGISTGLTITLVIIAIVIFIMTALIFSVANVVFNTALYIYATSGVVPDGFNSEELSQAFRNDKSKGMINNNNNNMNNNNNPSNNDFNNNNNNNNF